MSEAVRAECRAVCAYVAKMGADGATYEDIARALPHVVRPHDLKARVGRCFAFGLISVVAGETKRGQDVWHITRAGCEKLGLPADDWVVDAPIFSGGAR